MVTLRGAGSALSRSLLSSLLPMITVIALLFSWVLNEINDVVPEPYMDEIFHIPQAQKYCNHRFDEWDPKITTFPGLYLVPALYAELSPWTNGNDVCSVSMLRSVNVVFAVGNVVLCVLLRHHVAPQDPNAMLHALRIAVFPPLFFFTFLFYTDAGATFFVLLMVLLAEKVKGLQYSSARGSFVLSAMSGALAVLFRQTNIVWVAFVAGTVIARRVELTHSTVIYKSRLKQDTNDCGSSSAMHSDTSVSSSRLLLNFIGVVFSNLPSILQIVWPFIVVVACFIAFLITNGGIVVGDRSNHEMSFHGAQILYFVVIAASGFGLYPVAPAHLMTFARTVRRNGSSFRGLLFMMFLIAATVGVVFRFSPVHKFMLADNRHYTFYVWRKFFLKHDLAKLLPAPLYLFLGWYCWRELGKRRSPLWKLVYTLAVCLVLVPSPLVEPRYYCVPFAIFHLNTSNQSGLHLWIVVALYMAVNALTLYIFLYHPYDWVDGSTARFMW